MGSISFSEKCARRASDGAWSWGGMSGEDYVDNNSFNYYCVVYKANVTYSGSETLQSVTAGVHIYAGGSTLALNGATVRGYLYTSDPTGGGSLPSGISSGSTATDMTSTGSYYSFTFSGLNITSSVVYIGFTVDKPSQYGSTAHAVAQAGTAGISGVFSGYVPPGPTTYYRVTAAAGTGIASTSGSGQYSAGYNLVISCTVMSGYNFDGWYVNGVKVGSNLTYNFIVAQDITVTAMAVSILPTYTIIANPGDFVTSVTGGGSYQQGSICTLRATLPATTDATEYVFDGWYVDDMTYSVKVSESNPYSFAVTGFEMLIALGKPVQRAGVHIYDTADDEWYHYEPFVYDSTDGWHHAIPYTYSDGEWKLSVGVS